MSRSKLREKVFQLVFRVAFNDEEELAQQAEFFFGDEEQEGMTEKEQQQIQEKFDAVVAKLNEIDAQIDEKSTGWNVGRLGKVELAILRLAVYEIVYDESIPGSVAINEAVELAKKYAAQESPAFINGVLAKFVPKEDK
ncbi:MAG: transcription antitermination factor NusB [Lachnospiraceae bacterium]|nr:transcription antitermination factor NusB [Lachnospiraceae bacterium]